MSEMSSMGSMGVGNRLHEISGEGSEVKWTS